MFHFAKLKQYQTNGRSASFAFSGNAHLNFPHEMKPIRSFSSDNVHFTKFAPKEEHIKKFAEDGFIIVPHLISKHIVDHLVSRLEPLFSG
jgi:hypothetical protein